MDLTFTRDQEKFNYRVGAVIIHENRLLIMKDDQTPHYYLPGGRVTLGERAEDALLREVQEELGVEASILRPLWLNQAFFQEELTGMDFHELCLYFLLDISRTSLLQRGRKFSLEEEGRVHNFEWVDFESLKDRYFYPLFLKEHIFKLPEVFTLRTEIE